MKLKKLPNQFQRFGVAFMSLMMIFGQANPSWSAPASEMSKGHRPEMLVNDGLKALITGRVTDNEGIELAGVNVVIKGTAKGTITDAEGQFSLEVQQGDILVFSFIGYKSQEIAIAGQSSINILLESNVQLLESLVVTGYGVREKRDITGAVANIRADEIENMPVQSFDRAIQGRAAGVQVTGDGIPGGRVNIEVRGRGSITGSNNPLFIIDGMQMTSPITSDNIRSTIQSENPLNTINPNDIESIDILKDASATAIYGAQGANGVIIITTKRGKAGKTRFNLNTSWGSTRVINQRDVLNASEFAELSLEAYENRFGLDSDDYRDALANIGSPDTVTNYDWQEAAYREGFIENYELSASGGGDKTSFFISGAYNRVKGHVVETGFQRGGLRINVDHKANDRLTLSTSNNLARTVQRVPTQGNSGYNPNRIAHLIAPISPIYLSDGSLNPGVHGDEGIPLFGAYTNNVILDAQYNDSGIKKNTLLSNLAVAYQLPQGLTFRSSYSLDYQLVEQFDYIDPRASGEASKLDNRGQRTAISTQFFNWQTDQTLTYDKTIADKHQLNLVAGFFYRQSEREALSARGQGFITPKLDQLANSDLPVLARSGYTTFKTAGVFAQANYIFDDKYIVGATLRRDGHSRFGDDNRWGTFPALSAAWRVSSEPFMERFNWLSDLKLRASFGITGNSEINDFAARSIYTTTNPYRGRAGLVQSRLANNNLAWEENQTTNFGLNIAVAQGRVSVAVDHYIRNNEGLLLDRVLPNTSGFDEITENAGSIQNRGWEFELNTVNVVAGGFQWRTSANLALLKSEVTSLPDNIGDTLILSSVGQTFIVGEEAFGYFTQPYAGVNAADGRPFYLDENGHPTYRNNGGDARTFQGTDVPKWSGGITNTFTYKGFSLSTLFQFEGGHLINNVDRFFLEEAGSRANKNQGKSQLRRWQAPGDVTDVPVAVLGFAYPNDGADRIAGGNNRSLEPGDYLRLKQVQLSYDFPAALLQKWKLSSVQVYAQAINVWTITEYTGYDPELLGSDFGDMPAPKTFIFGTQIGF